MEFRLCERLPGDGIPALTCPSMCAQAMIAGRIADDDLL